MIEPLKKLMLIPLATLCRATLLFSQEPGTGPLHFDQAFSITDPGSATYKGYTEKVNSAFVTTFFAHPAVKIAKLSFADKGLSRKHGAFTGFNGRGDILFVSHYKNNRMNGEWMSWYANRMVCDSGKLVDNLPDGVWKTWFEDGRVQTIRSFDAFKYHRIRQDINKPRHSVFFPLAAMAKADREAFHLHTNAGNAYNASAFSHMAPGSVPVSLKEIADNNTSGSPYLPSFRAGLLHGLYMNFYPDGAVKDSGYYKNGLREGVWEEWLESGSVRATGYYNHGHKKNTWKYYNSTGKLLYIQHYDRHGRPEHSKEFTR